VPGSLLAIGYAKPIVRVTRGNSLADIVNC